MKPLDEGLRKLENFITALEGQIDLDSDVCENPEIMFAQKDEGGLALSCEEAREYVEYLNVLSSPKAVGDRYSRKAVEKLMQTAILKALDINKQRVEKTFEQRLKGAIKELRAALKAKPKLWTVHMRVDGLAPDGLPQRFGKAEFYVADEPRIEQLKQSINAIIDSGSSTAETKQSAKAHLSQNIEDFLRDSPMASIEVMAGESQAALSLARRELRLTMDVINFYSDILYQSGLRAQVYPLGELQPTTELSVLLESDTPSFALLHSTVGPLKKVSFGDIDPQKARQVGF